MDFNRRDFGPVWLEWCSDLERILHDQFDLVLLDLMLPERTGFEVLDAIFNRVGTGDCFVGSRCFLPTQKLRIWRSRFRTQAFFMEGSSLGFAPDWFDAQWRQGRFVSQPTWSLISMLGWFSRTARISG